MNMKRKNECVMCKSEAVFIDIKTGEPLCERCASINEGIYRSKGKVGKYKRIRE